MNEKQKFNAYDRQLTSEETGKGAHREFVGGLWDELGQLQFDFLVDAGLQTHHSLCDLGCGCFRGGIHFIKYLDSGNYYGVDINQSLLNAGKTELEEAGLGNKRIHTVLTETFDMSSFDTKMDFILSVSLFTHLPMSMILLCLRQVRQSLKPDGQYFTTYFNAPHSVYTKAITHEPGNITTHHNQDPYHYSLEEMQHAASESNLSVQEVLNWKHPRNQKMLVFTLK